MEPWVEKANRIIAELCRESYLKANRLPNGRMRKKHVPYSIPQDAELLVECLRNGDEEKAKAIFMRHAYGAVNY